MLYSQLNLFLLFIVLISKEFLIFNEEILVLLAFGLFTYLLVTYAGQMIAEELDSHGNKIKEEFNLYKDLQKKTLLHLIEYHKKQKKLSEELKDILNFSKFEIMSLEKFYPNFLNTLVTVSLDERFKRIITNETNYTSSRQADLFSELKIFY